MCTLQEMEFASEQERQLWQLIRRALLHSEEPPPPPPPTCGTGSPLLSVWDTDATRRVATRFIGHCNLHTGAHTTVVWGGFVCV